MVDKTITADELIELVNSGARITTPTKPMVIEQFNELLDKLNQMIAANEERAQADLARSQTQLEVLATLQALIRQNQGVNRSPPVDLKPLYTVLSEIQEAQRPAVAYEFDIQRDGRGFQQKIIATPIKPTLN